MKIHVRVAKNGDVHVRSRHPRKSGKRNNSVSSTAPATPQEGVILAFAELALVEEELRGSD